MATPNPLQLPHSARQAFLTGPTITLALPLPSIGTTYTIPSLPRRMLFAFSHLAAAQLTVADGVNTTAPTPSSPNPDTPSPTPTRTITLPPSSCTPAALELLLQYLKQCCRDPSSSSSSSSSLSPPPPPPLSTWRQAVRVYAATRALRVVHIVEASLRGWIDDRLNNANESPLSVAELRDAVEALGYRGSSSSSSSSSKVGEDDGDGNRVVKEVVRKTAAWARRPDVGGLEVEREEMKAWLGKNQPELLAWWEVCDRKAVNGRRLDVRWVERVKSRSYLRAESGRVEEVDVEGKKEELQRKVEGLQERLKKQRSLVELTR